MLVQVFCGVGVVYVVALAWQHRRYREEAPVVFSAIPFLGSALDFAKDAYAFVAANRRKYGDVFAAVVAGRRMVFVCEEKAASKAITRHSDLSFSPVALDVLLKAFGLEKKDVDDYERTDADIHKVSNEYLLKGASLSDLTGRASRAIDNVLDKIVEENKNLYNLVKSVVFESTVSVIFGEKVLGSSPATLLAIFDDLDDAFPALVGGAPVPKGARALKTLAARFRDSYETKASDFIKARTKIFRNQGEGPNNIETASQTSLLWAVVANTMPAAFWTLFYLIQNKEYVETVRKETQSTKDPDLWKFLDRALTESLRLSSGSLVVRDALRPATLTTSKQTFKLRQGDRVCVFPPLAHFDPLHFKDPRLFDPNREPSDKVQAFGAGVSMCPGRLFAKREIKLVVAKMLTRFDFDLADPHAPPPPLVAKRAGLGIYPPSTPVFVNLASRANKATKN